MTEFTSRGIEEDICFRKESLRMPWLKRLHGVPDIGRTDLYAIFIFGISRTGSVSVKFSEITISKDYLFMKILLFVSVIVLRFYLFYGEIY